MEADQRGKVLSPARGQPHHRAGLLHQEKSQCGDSGDSLMSEKNAGKREGDARKER